MDHQHSWFSFQAFCTVDHLHAYVTAIPQLYSTHPDVPANAEWHCLQAQVFERETRGELLLSEPRSMFGNKVRSD